MPPKPPAAITAYYTTLAAVEGLESQNDNNKNRKFPMVDTLAKGGGL